MFCRCGGGIFSEAESDKLSDALRDLDAEVFELHDLCSLTLHEKEIAGLTGNQPSKKIIIACSPRAVRALLHQNGLVAGAFELVNFREKSADEVARILVNEHGISSGTACYRHVVSKLGVPAWYPVIDYERCTFCGQCAHFCLFGVYKSGRKSLAVVNPLACKNNCPACGRICPESAIIFPRLPENSVLSGAEVIANDGPGGRMEEGNLYARLKERNLQRRSIFTGNLLQMAEVDRDKALKEMDQQGNQLF